MVQAQFSQILCDLNKEESHKMIYLFKNACFGSLYLHGNIKYCAGILDLCFVNNPAGEKAIFL